MGVGWRRFTESFKQHTPLGGSLSPTSNDRVRAMLEEADIFDKQLRHLMAKIDAASTANKAVVEQTVEAVQAPLPRVFHEVAQAPPASPGGSPTTSASPGTPGGQLVKTDRLTTLVPAGDKQPGAADLDPAAVFQGQQAATARLHEEVLVPLQAWLDALGRAHVQAKEVERVRLEVDSRRRTVSDMTVKEAQAQAALQRTQDAKHSARLEEASVALRHKSDKLAASAARFNEQEATLHAELSSLIQDTVHLRNYAASALRTLADGLVAAAGSIAGDTATVPMEPPAAVMEPGTAAAAPGTVPAPAAGTPPPAPAMGEEAVPPAGHLSAEGGTPSGTEFPGGAQEELAPGHAGFAKQELAPGHVGVAGQELAPGHVGVAGQEMPVKGVQGLHITTPTAAEGTRVVEQY